MIGSKDKKAQSKRHQTSARAIVAPDALDSLKRRAEEAGLIVHAKTTTARREQKDKRQK